MWRMLLAACLIAGLFLVALPAPGCMGDNKELLREQKRTTGATRFRPDKPNAETISFSTAS